MSSSNSGGGDFIVLYCTVVVQLVLLIVLVLLVVEVVSGHLLGAVVLLGCSERTWFSGNLKINDDKMFRSGTYVCGEFTVVLVAR